MYVIVMIIDDPVPDVIGPFASAGEAHKVRTTKYHYVPNHQIAVVPVITVEEYENE